MRKCRGYLAVCLMLVMLLLLGGCGKKYSVELGQWEEHTFTNEWYGFALTLPDGWQILEADEIQELLGAGQNVIVNDGLMTEKEIEKAEGKTFYDFYVFDSTATSSLALGYELVSSCTEEEYLEIVKGNLESLESIQYTIGELEQVTIGAHDYWKMPASLYGGVVLQEYYVCRYDEDVMAFLIVTYNESTQAEFQTLLESIQ